MIRHRIFNAGLLVALFAVGWAAGRGGAASDAYRNLDVFVEVLHRVEQNYVDRVEPRQLVEGGMRGMLRQLDPYSQYLDDSSLQNLESVTHGTFGGVGMVVSVRDGWPVVISPLEGGPAWNAGVRPGDVIARIESKSAAGLTVEEVASKLRGPQGTRVTLHVRGDGEGEEEREITIERKQIETHSVPYAFVVEKGIGYLRLSDFSEKSGPEVRAALERLRQQGASRLVLDLRANPGGLLDQAVDVAEQFLPPNTMVVFTKGRARGQSNRYFSDEPRPQLQWPLVVLVDGGSASASEIVAGALQDLDRGLVVGQTTFGKGSVQSLYPLRGRDGGIKLTTALYYTPSGRSIHDPSHNRVVDLNTEDGEEEADLPETPAAGDSTPPPAFRTSGGRTVYGGGGIRPDLEVRPDSLFPLTRRVESRGLTFRFANRWANGHPNFASSRERDAALWPGFVSFLRETKTEFTEAELAAERTDLERALRRELARRAEGDAGAARVALEVDPAFLKALDVLKRARGPREVLQ